MVRQMDRCHKKLWRYWAFIRWLESVRMAAGLPLVSAAAIYVWHVWGILPAQVPVDPYYLPHLVRRDANQQSAADKDVWKYLSTLQK